MKKTLFILFLALCGELAPVNAQRPFPTTDSIDINNISASVLVHGDMWWSPVGGGPRCSFPKGSGRNIAFASALWMSGYDGGGGLHVAAQTYRQTGNDYWPGPLDADSILTYRTSYYWAKIWKVNRTDIQSFQAMFRHTKSNTPAAILTWPAKGNAYAQGNAGYPLVIKNNMAPFIDLNSNGIYEPLSGDYPDIKGDQALWWVFNDDGPTHSETNGKPLKVEVHAMSYAYKRGSLIDNVIYYEYDIINKSANTYNNFRAGIKSDVNLGYAFDDFIGYDATHRMGIAYNGTNDDGGSAGHPVNSYGSNSPMMGVSLVSLPGDARPIYVPAGSCVYFSNDFSVVGNPEDDGDYDNYLRAKLRNGAHFTNDYGGPGIPTKGFGSGADANYVFPGDPSDHTQWSECNSNNNPGERRFILSSNDFTLSPGGSQKIVMALIAADSTAGCPLANFSKIKIVADTAWEIYQNPPAPKPAAISNLANAGSIHIYPNPAHDRLYIESSLPQNADEQICIYNLLGQQINVVIDRTTKMSTIDVSQLPSGVYTVIFRNSTVGRVVRFVKE